MTPEQLVAQILETLRCQARTTPAGRAIAEAGLGDQLERLMRACARNVAQTLLQPEE